MRVFLLLCLIAAALNCNIISTVLCILGNEKVHAIAKEVINAIKNKEWDSLLSIAFNNFNNMKDVVVKCLKPEDDEVVLKDTKEELCIKNCSGGYQFEPDPECVKYCIQHA